LTMMKWTAFFLLGGISLLSGSVDSFSTAATRAQDHSKATTSVERTRSPVRLNAAKNGDSTNDNDGDEVTRRQALSIFGLATTAAVAMPSVASAADVVEFKPGNRPFAYRIDSTTPPTLLPMSARQEQSVLKGLGRGSGTGKAGVVQDRLTLNNMMNKGVFGTIGAVQTAMGTNEETIKKQGTGFATFVAMGVPAEASAEDIGLATSLLSLVMQGRKSFKAPTALALPFAPLSTQSALEAFQSTGNMADLLSALTASGVSEATSDLYKPLLEFAKTNSMDLLAMSPEIEDLKTVRAEGLQNVNKDRRSQYVADSEGFIALTQDPKFRMYTDRSLLKDFVPTSKDDQPGNFFAERILAHETGATAVARYATARPESLVAFVAPIADVRFIGGFNGRLPRVCQFINKEKNKVNDDCVTTILLNPSAKETLSLSRYLRLEIGTAPANLDYQTKVSDYLWFSKMPKVNMIPRLMNG